MKIGLRLASFHLPLRRALQAAQRAGAAGVQLDAVNELLPYQLSQTARRELRQLARSHNLEISAVGCPMRRGLNVAENIEARLEHVCKVMTLAIDLGPRVIIVEAGKIAEQADPPPPGNVLLGQALHDLARHADHTGATLALDMGSESAATMTQFLDRFDTGSLAVNFDPANLLAQGFDVYGAPALLQRRIAHVHAKDARAASASRTAAEVLLGHGDIDWLRLLDRLREVDYHGWLTIEREAAPLTEAEASAGVGFLRRLV